MPSYNQELRAIGQALESEGISTFELRTDSERYTVSGAPEKSESFMAVLSQWRHGKRRREPRTITYTTQDIFLLEQKGRARRAIPGQLPDFYNVSNILRTFGTYLDAKNARLIELQKRPLTVTLLYQAPGENLQVEDRSIASFYKIFIDLHGKRSRSVKF
jgi:hypothetical protein